MDYQGNNFNSVDYNSSSKSYDISDYHLEHNRRLVSSKCPTGGNCKNCTGRCRDWM
jgi:hypothetical protein